MRVISGKYKGKRLISPQGNEVRPTSDRIKETLFNMLICRKELEGTNVLDLFSGSGALGIEALSRGAKSCVFIDKAKESIELTKKNLSFVKEDYRVFNTDYSIAIKKLEGQVFDIVFADPPYDAKLESKLLNLIFQHKILDKSGILVIEHDTKNTFEKNDAFIIETKKCGNTSLSLINCKEGCYE